jgi:hypothetical protein
MRLLLLSFLPTVYSAIACGTATVGGTGYFISTTTTCAACGGGDEDWWAPSTDGSALDDVAADTTCNSRPTKALLASSAFTTDANGFWDSSDIKNYEVNPVAVTIAGGADTVGNTKPSAPSFTDGFAVLFLGETYGGNAKTSILANTVGTTAATGAPSVIFCAGVGRHDKDTITQTQAVETSTTKPTDDSKCLKNGTWEIKADGYLNHSEVGNATKFCSQLPAGASTATPTACTALETCDRFFDGSSGCITTTTKLTHFEKVAGTKVHCTRFSGKTDEKYRALDKAYGSKACAATEVCNYFSATNDTTAPICIPEADLLATSAKAEARVVGDPVKWCLASVTGEKGAKKCTALQNCNPHSATDADLCILTTKKMDFGAEGAATTPDLYCIGDNTAGGICTNLQICNYAGGTQSDTAATAGGDVCILKTKLLGDISTNWTAAAQRKIAGEATKFCLATDGTTFSSNECSAVSGEEESCNPHASNPADTCIVTATLLNHGELTVEENTEADAVNKRACIAKSKWKNCSFLVDGIAQACNEGATTDDSVCISTENLMNATKPLEAWRVEGVAEAADRKWCFDTLGAKQCTELEMCNPKGKCGSGHEATCVTIENTILHGEAATADKNICVGNKKSSTNNEETEPSWLCDHDSGLFIDPSLLIAHAEQADDTLTQCKGVNSFLTCEAGAYCNESGTALVADDCQSDTTLCTKDNLCIPESIFMEDASELIKDGADVCVQEQEKADSGLPVVTRCTFKEEEKQWCDRATGTCVTTEPSKNPTDGSGGGTTSGCATKSIAAAVFAILSA